MHSLQQILRREQIEKKYRHGTNRCCTPQETRSRIAPLLSAMGITRVANVTGLDHVGLPIFIVYRPNARSLSSSQGKGISVDDSRASGLMEAVESFHAEHIEQPLRTESYAKLRREATVVNVEGLPRTSGSRFDRKKCIPWIEGYDLLNERRAWVPFELVHTDFRIPPPAGSGYFLQTSNGIAAGNHFLEALNHAVSEVIEADAIALWGFREANERQKRRIALETVDDPACRQTIETYERAGIAVAAWDITTDVGVPSFECLIVGERGGRNRRLYATGGSGSHPAKQIALQRALLEAAQGRLTLIAGSRDDFSRQAYAEHQTRRVLDGFRAEISGNGAANFRAIPSFEGRTLNDDLDWLLKRLRGAGIEEVVAVDLSKPELGIPVVRAIVPHLEGLSLAPRYVPGRRAKNLRDGGR